ncbi:MAG TPA: hypothetical protein PLA19_01450 [Candidatus Pacearchaeota archaeon]|jgi:hypothetical protein|nr:hypothetical protein [Candidatus Pacearchaeota archaeon]
MESFNFEGKNSLVVFVETMEVDEGVECDVYEFVGDKSKDLGIIRIKAGCKTPLQKVLKGTRTIEGYISGKGGLAIIGRGGKEKIYNAEKRFEVEVKIGELMQWQAAPDSDLEVIEFRKLGICCLTQYILK